MITIPKKYYCGDKLLEQKDINGNTPGVFLSNSNRSAGKTTFFQIRTQIEDFLEKGAQFLVITRNKAELADPETMFEFAIDKYFPDILMTSKWYVSKVVMGIYIDNKIAGFGICLKDAVKLKKYSAIFARIENAVFDELQPDDGKYLRNEYDLMTSIIKTVSRGNGKQSRYIRWIFLSNNISIMNPYFLNMEIYKQIPDNFHLEPGEEFYIRGDGYVAEFTYNQSAAQEMEENPAIRAFKSSINNRIGVTADFMISTNAFIAPKMSGKMDYIYTLKYKGTFYGVRRHQKTNYVYITHTYDPYYKLVIALSDTDHDELTVQLRDNTFYMAVIRDGYSSGKLRFSNLEVKNAIIELLGIDLYR